MSRPNIIKHWQEHCRCCSGLRSGDVLAVRGERARFEVLFPSRCPTKGACEREIIDALGIQPVIVDGEILR